MNLFSKVLHYKILGFTYLAIGFAVFWNNFRFSTLQKKIRREDFGNTHLIFLCFLPKGFLMRSSFPKCRHRILIKWVRCFKIVQNLDATLSDHFSQKRSFPLRRRSVTFTLDDLIRAGWRVAHPAIDMENPLPKHLNLKDMSGNIFTFIFVTPKSNHTRWLLFGDTKIEVPKRKYYWGRRLYSVV